jgi:uncharacterized protein (DUF58 family)
LTQLRPEDLDDLLPAVEVLQRRHLVLVANLREAKLDDALHSDIREFRDALRYHGVWEHRLARKRVHETLQRSGAIALDVTPAKLPAHLINSYYAIKRSGAL